MGFPPFPVAPVCAQVFLRLGHIVCVSPGFSDAFRPVDGSELRCYASHGFVSHWARI